MKKVGLNNKLGKAFQRHSAGFTLIEVLIALALFAIIAIVFAGGLATASKAVLTADVRTRAESLARTQMESIKNQDYVSAVSPAWQAAYEKILLTDVPPGYLICSCNATGSVVNCTSAGIIAVAWNSEESEPAGSETGLEKITLVIEHDGTEVTRLEGYKVDR